MRNATDPISAAGNLRMNHVTFLFQHLVRENLARAASGFDEAASDLTREFGQVICYSDHRATKNLALKREIANFLRSSELVPDDYDQKQGSLEGFRIGENRVIILHYVDKFLTDGFAQDEWPDPYDNRSTHYTVLQLLKDNESEEGFVIRYADSLSYSADMDRIPVVVRRAIHDYGLVDSEDSMPQIAFASAKQGLTSNCGYCAVYNALDLLGMRPKCSIDQFIAEQRRFLEDCFGKEGDELVGDLFSDHDYLLSPTGAAKEEKKDEKTPSKNPSIVQKICSKIADCCECFVGKS